MSVKTISVHTCDGCGKENLSPSEVFVQASAVISADGKKRLHSERKSKKEYCKDCAADAFKIPAKTAKSAEGEADADAAEDAMKTAPAVEDAPATAPKPKAKAKKATPANEAG